MSSQYRSLKQEAQIYEHLTGKKCSIYHNSENLKDNQVKFPSAVKHRALTQARDQSNYNKNRRFTQFVRKQSSLHNPQHRNDLYSNIIRQGIKMKDMQDNQHFASKAYNYRKKISEPRGKVGETDQSMKHRSMRNKISENKINIFKIQKPQFNTVSSPSIPNHRQDLMQLDTYTHQNHLKFLSLNKKNIISINTKQKQTDSFTTEKMGKSKRDRNIFDQKNKEQIRLQQDLKQYHCETKPFIQEMKMKYRLNFQRNKKYLKKFKHSPIFSINQKEEELNEDEILFNQGIKFDQLSEQIIRLDLQFKENNKKLQKIQKDIQCNKLYSYLKINDDEKLQSDQNNDQMHQQQQNTVESYQKRFSIIQKLKNSLMQLNLKANQESNQSNKQMKVNQRLKDLLF